MTRAHRLAEQRFAAKMLFQFRCEGDLPGGFRTVEERIVLILERSASAAYSSAQRRGDAASYSYLNDAGERVYFEYVGVTDLMNLGPEADDDEVWYEIRRMRDPMQRRTALIPEKTSLDAFKLEKASKNI